METSVTLDSMYSMKSSIVIFEGTMKDGLFSRNRIFYDKSISDEEIEERVKECRIRLGNKYGFSGLQMFEPHQKKTGEDIHPDNKAVIIDETYMTKDDYYQEDIPADILIITSKFKKVALCHRMGDCPVIIAEDRKKEVAAIAHCGMAQINRELPKAIVETLINNFNSNPEDIYVYVGSHIKKEHYDYDCYPKAATNEKVWKDAITKKGKMYYIDLEKAILNQLESYTLGEIRISPIDTFENEDYASHKALYSGNLSKKGQNIVGFYFK